MNYRRIYIQLVNRAIKENRQKNKGIYYENHHIFPKSIYPQYTNNKHNFVLLTAREHFIAHLLCYKIWPCKEMACAMWCFISLNTNNKDFKVSSKVYEQIRNEFNTSVFTEERKKLQSEISKTMWKNRTEEERKEIGKKISKTFKRPDIKLKKSIATSNALKNNNDYYNRCCETLRKNIQENKDKPEWREKIRQTNLKTWSDPKKIEEQRKLSQQKYKEKVSTGWSPWENRYKPIRCVNNGMEFKTIEEAKKWAVQASKIVEVLHGHRETAGKDPITGEKLKWEYVNKN